MFVSHVNIQPNRAGLSGIASLESIVGALLKFVAAVAGIAFSAITMVIGSHSGNPHVAVSGKSEALARIEAALALTAAVEEPDVTVTPRVFPANGRGQPG